MTSVRAGLAVLVCVFAAAVPAEAAQAPLGGGAWSWFGDPRAVTHDGRTYVGWVDHEGDIKVSSYDHATQERVTAVLQARLNQDDHANPSIHVRPDGKLMVFYSRHVGPAMHYRVSSLPGDVRSWEAPQTVPVNVPGNRGYTYPNPIRLEQEKRTYLFWRGGNYNPTYSILPDGSDQWSAARNLIDMPGERPYVKYDSSGQDTIHVAYTNAHPNEYPDVNIYYARVHDGRIETASGTDLGPLGEPIHPTEGDTVLNPGVPSWVHDVAADSDGRPVIVFATFPSQTDHRYWYARWTGTIWERHEVTAAGGSFREDGGSPYYSGGLTLDHEDPSRVYVSRQLGAGSWQVETWETANGGEDWTSHVVSLPETQRNVRPVSPRGMPTPFDDDLSVIWMRGSYPNYEAYETSITATAGEENLPPIADAEPSVRSGPAPLQVSFTALAEDPDGQITDWQWEFGDGTQASGAAVTHTYSTSGRYFPTLTVTDDEDDPLTPADESAKSTFVEEIAVGLPVAPVTHTGGAAGSTVHGAVDPENRETQWYFEYGPTNQYGARTAAASLPGGDSLHQVWASLPGLVSGRLYHYRLVASNGSGSTEGDDRVMVAGSAAGSDDYRDAVLGTPGLAAYWRLGELSGAASHDELGGGSGVFAGRFVLGQPGVLGALGNTSASFDGVSGERAGPGPALSSEGTMEGWFRWRTGTAVMRDNTGPNRGWLLAFNSGGTLRYRVGGQGYDTRVPIEDVRDGAWHHIVATKSGGAARLYVDGAVVHSGTGADSDVAALPWHVMRNGSNNAYADGEADEVALYTEALSADEVSNHFDAAQTLAAKPLPPETPDPVVDPPAAGTGLGGGVLGQGGGTSTTGGGAQHSTPFASPPAGKAFVRRGTLIVRGAPGTRNRLSARRRGRSWRIADAAARLRPGAGCKRLGPRAVSCRAARVKRIEMHGGAGADILTVTGHTRAILVGGPGADRLVGGPRTRFRGGPGADRQLRRRT